MAGKALLNVDDIGRVMRLLKIALVAIAVIAGLSAYMSTKGSYSTSASVAVIPPAKDTEGRNTNPIADIDYKTTQLALIAVELAGDPVVADAADQQGADLTDASTTVGDRSGASNLTPRVQLTATAETAAKSTAGVESAIRALQIAFAQFQTRAGVAGPRQQAKLVLLFRGDPVLATTSRLRAAAGTFLGVLLLGIVILTLLNKPRQPPPAERSDEPGPPPEGRDGRTAEPAVAPGIVATSRTRPTSATPVGSRSAGDSPPHGS